MFCSAAFLLEVREPVSLKVITKDYFRGKKCQDFTYLALYLYMKKEGV